MAISRRTFVAQGTVAGAGLLIGVRLSPTKAFAQENEKGPKAKRVNPFDAYVHVKPDGKVSLIVAKSEMGQGIKTGLAMLLAEEAAVDFDSVTVEQAETRPDIYTHMGTGGSGSTRQNFMPLRRAGATVRLLMITAAAQKWNVPAKECGAKSAAVLHEKSSRRASYGELVETAMKLPLPDPEKIELEDEADFTLIGQATPRVDIPSKVDGSAVFGLDVRVPEMLFAVVARCPTFGGKHANFDASKARAVPGVKDVFEIPALGADMFTAGGVTVVANSTWAAMKAATHCRSLGITVPRQRNPLQRFIHLCIPGQASLASASAMMETSMSCCRMGQSVWRRRTNSPSSRTPRWNR